MDSPEIVQSLVSNVLETPVIEICHIERVPSRAHNEDNDTKGKDVCHLGLVGVVHEDFRRHVILSANHLSIRAQAAAIRSRELTRTAKINDL